MRSPRLSRSVLRFVAGETDGREAVSHTLSRVFVGEAEIQWAKGDILEDGGAEELIVGILEEEADSSANFRDRRLRYGNSVD